MSVDPTPEVSAVLGSFNRLPLLKLAIESVRQELTGLNGEIIVVDGGSTDGSVEWLTAQQDIVSIIQHNRYRTEQGVRRRMTWGRFMNLGFCGAAGKYVMMISDDCYLLPGAIKNGIAQIEAASAAGLNPGACAFYFRNWPSEDRYYVQRTLGGNLMLNHGIYTRKALEAVNFANEDEFIFYKCDSDLSLRIWSAGYQVIDCKRSVCEHYADPAEEVRASNVAMMDYDRDVFHRRWPQYTSPDMVRKMGKIELTWADPERTAETVWGKFARRAEGMSKGAAEAGIPNVRV